MNHLYLCNWLQIRRFVFTNLIGLAQDEQKYIAKLNGRRNPKVNLYVSVVLLDSHLEIYLTFNSTHYM